MVDSEAKLGHISALSPQKWNQKTASASRQSWSSYSLLLILTTCIVSYYRFCHFFAVWRTWMYTSRHVCSLGSTGILQAGDIYQLLALPSLLDATGVRKAYRLPTVSVHPGTARTKRIPRNVSSRFECEIHWWAADSCVDKLPTSKIAHSSECGYK